mmetsp:Transcript_20355/g.36375  ORF Transcript_20355/g.36375 Transcript_20355/m.36375 type:complete len:96 (+) Transcript_20355:552-839(+)
MSKADENLAAVWAARSMQDSRTLSGNRAMNVNYAGAFFSGQDLTELYTTSLRECRKEGFSVTGVTVVERQCSDVSSVNEQISVSWGILRNCVPSC